MKILHRNHSALSLCQKFWWQFMPGEIVSVKWPSGTIVVGMNDPRWFDCGARWVEIPSADPSDHYQPYLEENVGRKGWDWDWSIIGSDILDNRLSIKIRRAKSCYASVIAMMWS